MYVCHLVIRQITEDRYGMKRLSDTNKTIFAMVIRSCVRVCNDKASDLASAHVYKP